MESSSPLPLGVVVGEARPHRFHFLARRAVAAGEYVTVDSPAGRLLGLAEDSTTKSLLLEQINNFDSAIEAKKAAAMNPRDKNYVASVRVVGRIDRLKEGQVVIPSLPPEPGADVEEAESGEIEAIFDRKGREWVEIGTLLRSESVKVAVNLDKVASRHLAVMSVTGSGKSNLLALLAKRVAAVRGTMIVFDYHGEYSGLGIPNLVHAEAKVNPRYVDSDKLADLVDVRENADVQRSILNRALTEEVRKDKDFWKSLQAEVTKAGVEIKKPGTAARVQDIIDLALKRMKSVLDPDVGDELDQIRTSNVNILNMLEFTERQANAAISHYLEEILDDRKKATRSTGAQKIRFPTPVICAIEESHTFIPNDRDTDTKFVAAKVAREGRKFGMGLVIISQRPRRVDADVLSQMGSLAIMKLTNPEDQKHIRDASESVSEDLLRNLPSLNVGEAVLLGEWVNIPAVVKFEHVKEKTAGADISATSLWAEASKVKTVARESTRSAIKLD